LVDGCFDAAPTADGGWEARMTIPRHVDHHDESDGTA